MITRWPSGTGQPGMPDDILVELGDIIPRHPWWRARARLIVAMLETSGVRPPATVLEAGCGWGVNLEALESRGYQAAGLDISRRALERLDRPHRRLIEADLSQPPPPEAGQFDAVLALDVIEHLEDDAAAVAGMARLVRPGGLLAVSVPALPELFSEFDAIQGHRRRYLPETLRHAFSESPLEVERVVWWGAWMTPILRRQRRSERKQPGDSAAAVYRRYLRLPPWPASWILDWTFRFEHSRALRGELTTGTSLFCLARRPPERRAGPAAALPRGITESARDIFP